VIVAVTVQTLAPAAAAGLRRRRARDSRAETEMLRSAARRRAAAGYDDGRDGEVVSRRVGVERAGAVLFCRCANLNSCRDVRQVDACRSVETVIKGDAVYASIVE
jgi:hypothetical protein